MPPKRKRAVVDSEPTASGSRGGGGGSAAASTNKSKTKSSKSVDKKTTTGRKSKTKQKAEEPFQHNAGFEENSEPPLKKGNAQKHSDTSAEGLGAFLDSITPSVKKLPYTKARMEKLFATYADVDDPSIIGGEGLEKLCTDANIPMEGAQPLILAWLLEASELGKLTKDEWFEGLHMLQIDTLEKLNIALAEHEALLISKAPVPNPPSSHKKSMEEPYNRNVKYWHYAADASSAFLKFYHFVFSLAKAPQERNIDVEIAKVFWSTLLGQKYPLVNDLIEYINNKTSLKGINKDVWVMTLDFFRCVSPTLEGYDAEGAWPTLLDEFAAWKRATSTHGASPPTVSTN